MLLTDPEVHEATSLEEASNLMARYAPDARLLAGGTDLLVDLKTDRFNVSHIGFHSANRRSAGNYRNRVLAEIAAERTTGLLAGQMEG